MTKNFDRSIAAFIFIVATFVSAIAYASIVAIERPQKLFLSALGAGTRHYEVSTSNGCVGTVSSQVSEGNTSSLGIQGNLLLSDGAATAPAFGRFEAEFNGLGQMYASRALFRFKTARFALETRNINPIHIEISADFGQDKPLRYSADYPGPVVLRKVGPDEFELEHLALSGAHRNYLSLASQPALQELRKDKPMLVPLQVSDAWNTERSCSGQTQPIDLSGLLSKFSFLSSKLPSKEGVAK